MGQGKAQVYAIVRVEGFYDQSTPIENKITVKEIARSIEEAKTEVASLNTLNESTWAKYFGRPRV